VRNKIEDLRNHLFATLEALQDEDNPMPLDRAKSIAAVAQTLINSAKVEVDFLRVVGGEGTGFIPDAPLLPAQRASAVRAGSQQEPS
jgi:hypothetical protein